MKPASRLPVQGTLDFGGVNNDADADLKEITGQWQDAAGREKANRTIFAQRSLKPIDVLPEWQKQNEILGSEKDVERFVMNSLYVLNAPLENVMKGDRLSFYKFNPNLLPLSLKNRMQNEGIEKTMRLDFSYPPEKNAVFIHRSNPLVTVLADYMLETALEPKQNDELNAQLAARSGVYETNSVNLVTTILLVRLRHKIEMTRKEKTKTTLAEEALLLGFEGRKNPIELSAERLNALLKERPTGNLDKSVMEYELSESLGWWKENIRIFEEIAKERSDMLLADHRRVRQAGQDRGTYTVMPGFPVDLIGLYVLLPSEL